MTEKQPSVAKSGARLGYVNVVPKKATLKPNQSQLTPS